MVREGSALMDGVSWLVALLEADVDVEALG